MVASPKHPKMIIFSRKIPWLLGTTILGNHTYLRKHQVIQIVWVGWVNLTMCSFSIDLPTVPASWNFLKRFKNWSLLLSQSGNSWKMKLLPIRTYSTKRQKQKILFSAFFKGILVTDSGRDTVKVWYIVNISLPLSTKHPNFSRVFCLLSPFFDKSPFWHPSNS